MKSLLVSLTAAALTSSLAAQSTPTGPLKSMSPQRNFAFSPPVAQRAAIRLLEKPQKGMNAVLYVEFAPGQPAPITLTLELEREKLILRDDGASPDERRGDGVHSGFLSVDVQLLQSQQKRLVDAREIPVFAGREIVARAVAREVSPEKFRVRSAAEALKNVPVIPTRKNPEGMRRSRELARIQLPIIAVRPGAFIPLFPFVDPASIDAAKTIAITDPTVVEDPTRTFVPCSGGTPTPVGNPNGKWTFHHLMDEMANTAKSGISTDAFVRRWAQRWNATRTVNDFNVQGRPFVTNEILGHGFLRIDGTLDWNKAPFQLLAIMNRVDLRDNAVYGGTNAGEGRFVFGLVDPTNCAEKPMTVIFEYGIHRKGCLSVKAWGKQWMDLNSQTLPSAGYNTALEAITVQFTERGTNPAQLPNQNSLNQLRTNEKLSVPDWELREFHLAADDTDVGHLRDVATKRTPDITFNKTVTVQDFINANAADIVAERHDVPAELAGAPFLAGSALTPFGTFWDGVPPAPSAGITTPNSRFRFSLNTCNGCHAGETQTLFEHIGSGVPVPARAMSKFLTGDPAAPDGDFHMNDAAGEPVERIFNDLKNRRESLAKLVTQKCFFFVFFDPLRAVH
jgi:hypothetical protein